MICLNLARSKAALVVINTSEKLTFYLVAHRILQPIPKSRILKFHELSINRIALIKKQKLKTG
jgi:hypothetical protein